jgi:hypothetical protein
MGVTLKRTVEKESKKNAGVQVEYKKSLKSSKT